ncbi:hypothetical protein [Paludifilum halophilum]|uniref:Uncharacterized protein n=1 Tax=Paludifilum halophilum TaxID=1642702 RepID=A0A235B953_9BACL|nr:hypothetical protein [Paludifilum halophilum]OYD08762.1 hypothetical protein CHM34_02900 [Paludifilum halophilum]
MTKDRIIQAVYRHLEESTLYLITKCRDYEAARDALDELEEFDKATDGEKWFLAIAKCRELVSIVPRKILLDSADGELILAGAGE